MSGDSGQICECVRLCTRVLVCIHRVQVCTCAGVYLCSCVSNDCVMLIGHVFVWVSALNVLVCTRVDLDVCWMTCRCARVCWRASVHMLWITGWCSVCMHVGVGVHMYTCHTLVNTHALNDWEWMLNVHLYWYACVCWCAHICMPACKHVCVCMCVSVCMCVGVNRCTKQLIVALDASL